MTRPTKFTGSVPILIGGALGYNPADDVEDAPDPTDRALDLPTFGPNVSATTAFTTANDGGWTHAPDPHAIHGGGITVFGYVDMTTGDIEVRSVTDGATTASASFTLHSALDIDTHAAPALIFRPDGRIVAAYSEHNGATIYVRVSTNAYDITAWGAEQNLDATLGGRKYTYPTLVYLGDDLYLWYRDRPTVDTNSALAYSKSTSDGDSGTWSAQTIAYNNGTEWQYWKVDSSATRIHVAVTDSRIASPASKVYHFTFDGTNYRKTDGSSAGVAPLNATDATQVYGGADGLGWPQDIVADDDHPSIAYNVVDSASTNSIRYARWNGSAWVNATLASTNGYLETDVFGNVFGGNVYLDHSAPDTAYLAVKVGSFWEIQQWATDDDGASWALGQSVTSGSSTDNFWPVVPRNRVDSLIVLWLYGTYTGSPPYENAHVGVKGWGYGRTQQGNTTDGDDATYDAVTSGTDVLRIDLEDTFRIVRARLRLGSENAGSRTYSIYGANEADFSDETLLDSVTFTATGSFTAQDISFSWSDDGTARQYFRLEGTAESRRVYSFELFEASNNLSDYALADDLEDHIVDTTDAHDASAVSVVPFSTISATNVQAALEEIKSEAVGIGEILISDTPSTPLVFADLIQNEAQDDLVYADP